MSGIGLWHGALHDLREQSPRPVHVRTYRGRGSLSPWSVDEQAMPRKLEGEAARCDAMRPNGSFAPMAALLWHMSMM